MRTSKTFNVNLVFKDVEITCNTIDIIDFKSVYFVIRGWFDLNKQQIATLNKQIKKSLINNLDLTLFRIDPIIDVVDAPETMTNGFGHSMFEYTVFLKYPGLTTKEEVQLATKHTIKQIHKEIFEDPDFKVKKRRKELFI